ncbi:MAG: hypothetical protein PHF84_00270 [bacterium]|nr:hypothetical protein [bacterium]
MKKRTIVLLLVPFLLIIFLFLYGPLLPWSPLRPGYHQIRSRKAVVFIRDKNKLDPVYHTIDRIMAEAEKLYGLKYRKPVKVFVALDDKGRFSEMGRIMLWMRNYGMGGRALETGDVVYIDQPRIVRSGRKEPQYIRHELCHSLVQQNTGILKSMRITGQHWVSEGTACYFGGPYYMTRNEFVREWKKKKFTYQENNRDIYSNLDPMAPGFNYTLYRYFIQYLVETYGPEKFRVFLSRYIKDPRHDRSVFQGIFRIKLPEALALFEKEYKK